MKRIVLILAMAVVLIITGCSRQDRKAEEKIQIGKKEYTLRDGISSYLLLGVDREGNLHEEKAPGEGGQSDAIYLLICDEKADRVKILGIPRDTMTEISIYLLDGSYNGTSVDHLTLQYAFGDGREKSCELTEQAVSAMLYGIPIRGYLAVNLGAVPRLADIAGGIEVVVPDDTASSEVSEFVKGAVVTLDSSNMKKFLRYRDTEASLSAWTRMERHKAFFRGLVAKLRQLTAEDPARLLSLYRECEPEFITDIDPQEWVRLASMKLDEQVEILPGENVEGGQFDEYHIDDEALRSMVIRLFCEE